MNLGIQYSIETAKIMIDKLKNIDDVEIFIAPSFTSLVELGKIFKNTNIKMAAQNMSQFDSGAYTGEISPDWLIETGCEYVILGHSERRRVFGETDELINEKVKKALEKGLKVVLCIGETASERMNGLKETINSTQLDKSLKGISSKQIEHIIIAYEPVWAINSRALNPTGEIKAATPVQAEEMHVFIRDYLIQKYGNKARSIPLQYGGSVKPSNSEELFQITEINGGLVGGASLKPDDFSIIVKNASKIALS